MAFLDVNWLGIILATIASMALGMAWYMGLSKQWMAALGKTAEDIKAGGTVSPFVWAAAAQFVMAYFIAKLTPAVMGELTWVTGLAMGAHVWVGFIITAMVLNHRYQGQKWALTLIDGLYLLGVVLVQGVVLGLAGAP
ncbi:MAG: DUF1761 domain-containing protein [Alphaproteobacteria bacterium]|nr:DUF1761 domain-containing protein [Alphaproteobacteria bacterium]